MRNGLYKAAFRTPRGEGTGVVYLHDGRAHGGDAIQYYVGEYKAEGDGFTATLVSKAHSHYPGSGSVFGVDTAHMTLRGNAQGDTAQLSGTAKEAPGLTFQVVLTRIAD